MMKIIRKLIIIFLIFCFLISLNYYKLNLEINLETKINNNSINSNNNSMIKNNFPWGDIQIFNVTLNKTYIKIDN